RTAFSIRLKVPTETPVIRLHAPTEASLRVSSSATTLFAAATGNAYSFTLPSGEQIVGAVSLKTHTNGDFEGLSCQYAHLVGGKPRLVAAEMTTRFDAHALVAFAQMRYAEIPVIDSVELASLCRLANNTFTMQSGCGPSGACVDPVAAAS